MSREPNILQPLESALQQLGLADVALPSGAAPATGGKLAAWRGCCSTVFRLEMPSLAPDSGEASFDRADAEYFANSDLYQNDWVRSCTMITSQIR